MPISDKQGQAILDRIVDVTDTPVEALELCCSFAATFIYHHICAAHQEEFIAEFTKSLRACIETERKLYGEPPTNDCTLNHNGTQEPSHD